MDALYYVIKQRWFVVGLFLSIIQVVCSQQTTKDNYTGLWLTSTSWEPIWTTPLVTAIDINITINGYITRNGTLDFEGGDLIINDTLVIYGDLTLGNNSDITVNDNGILIIRGDLNVGNQTLIGANAYIVLTGNFTKDGSVNQGSFTSNDDPVKVFIGEAISPIALSDNNADFPALDCTSPPTTPYPNTSCSYGNMLDILNDPINPFFQTTCNPIITTQPTNVTDCENTIFTFSITASGASGYQWQADIGSGMGFQNITDGGTYSGATTNTLTVTDATSEYNGNTYQCVVIGNGGCTNTSNQALLINKKPAVFNVTGGGSYCAGGTGVTVGLNDSDVGVNYELFLNGATTTTIVEGTGTGISFGNQTDDGIYTIKANCNTDMNSSATISVVPAPTANAGQDQELNAKFETALQAELSSSETGEWEIISGSGNIVDIYSPVTAITNLSVGDNIFLWKVNNGICESSDEIIITVRDLFVPSIITPNGDIKNDYFVIKGIENIGPVKLTVYNRWGIEVYNNMNYENDWNGINNKGSRLPEDTYFYVLVQGTGKVVKGFVVIMR